MLAIFRLYLNLLSSYAMYVGCFKVLGGGGGNVHAKKKDWVQNVALEAETAITQLPTNEREVYRKLVADHIDTLQ
jgi:hypothetical protein